MSEPMKDVIVELRRIWKEYHASVHTAMMIPCDANPGDECSVDGFLDWLDREMS